jgi:transcriptional regulator with XRE-family HTH domain
MKPKAVLNKVNTYLNPKETGMKIWVIMTKKGLTPNDIKDEFGLTVQAIYKWLWGKTFPSLPQLVKLATILNVPLMELLAIE